MAHMMQGMTIPDDYRIVKLRDRLGAYWRAIGPSGIIVDELPDPESAAQVCWDDLKEDWYDKE